MSKRKKAYEQIRRAIVLGQVSAGRRLCETDWADRLGVNRTAVREACGRLWAEGLVVEGPRGGYFTSCPGPEDARDSLEIRVMLETGALERISRLGLNKLRNLEPLQKACDELEWLLRNGYHAEVAESDRRFHESLVAVAGSARLVHVYGCVLPIAPGPADGSTCPEPTGPTMLKEHRTMLAAIQKGHLAEAQRLLRIHLVRKADAGRSDDAEVA